MSRRRDDQEAFNTGCVMPIVIAVFGGYGVSQLFGESEAAFGIAVVVLLVVFIPVCIKAAEEEEYRRYARRRNRQAAKRERYDRERRR